MRVIRHQRKEETGMVRGEHGGGQMPGRHGAFAGNMLTRSHVGKARKSLHSTEPSPNVSFAGYQPGPGVAQSGLVRVTGGGAEAEEQAWGSWGGPHPSRCWAPCKTGTCRSCVWPPQNPDAQPWRPPCGKSPSDTPIPMGTFPPRQAPSAR